MPMADETYGGIENLEALEEAVNYHRFLLEFVCRGIAARQSVVDFGAGTGTLARALVRRGFSVTCVEPDAVLRARLAALGLRALADAGELPNDSSDVIYAINVLEHIRDDWQALRVLRTKLQPTGTLLLYVPAFPLLWSSMDRRVGHVRRYRRADLAHLLRGCGFAIDAMYYADSLGFFATLLYKALGKRDGRISKRSVRLYDRWVFPWSRWSDRAGLRYVFGKNLLAIARRDESRGGQSD